MVKYIMYICNYGNNIVKLYNIISIMLHNVDFLLEVISLSISLFQHNKVAYNSAVKMLAECNKAAIIHPTGTGKSFIGFKLCEDNSDKCICWVSPSEYIFQTQLENLEQSSNGYKPDNIAFFTYAKLMNMSDEEIKTVRPDYIILDEFHRCGAEMWGLGVKSLLSIYSDVPVLGLSATAIRYLDNQRDMSDELFDGNIASEMTLGEAIVRGILNPPKYVLSVFSYQKDLEKYEKRIANKKSKIVRDEGQKYLEALRRTLEQADGMEEIFSKHMTDKQGKYIVFCANYEHMQEMISISKEWFSKIDTAPHIYSAYSNNPDTSKAFAAFKTDNSNHLKLLYCIDMLNEGIHVDDISGVILLRPTVSPIIYKQQIGRALSANKTNNSVIFDIVLNIENLYSIGELNEEIELTTAYYRSLGEENLIVNEHFTVIDEVHDCIELFDKLENVLTASWDLMYECAKKYYEENGHLEVPARYFSEDGYSLGHWIYNQRSVRKGQMPGNLTDNQIEKLDKIGMRWELYTDYSWTRNYNAALEYFNTFGNLDVASRFITRDGVRLGEWLSNLRTWESSGVHTRYLTADRKKALEEIGMIWSKLNYYWENNFSAAVKYYKENGNLIVPSNFVSADGIRLGSWISRLRKLRKGQGRGTPPTPEQIKRLDDIGMVWELNITRKWDNAYAFAKRYFEEHGDLLVPSAYKTETGFSLGQWVQNQRKAFSKGTIDEARKKLLNQIGMVWNPPNSWLVRYNLVKKYYEEHGNIYINQTAIIEDVWLGKWIAVQKKLYDEGKTLTDEQRQLLEQLPLEQVNPKYKAWNLAYADAEEYYRQNNNLQVPSTYKGASGIILSDWIIRQRRAYRLNELTEEQITLLDNIGFVWELESTWDEGYRHAKEYFETFHNLSMQKSYKCSDGYALGIWVYNYRNAYNKKKSPVSISKKQIQMLEQIGMVWAPETTWDKRFADIQSYFVLNKKLPDANSENDFEKKLYQWLNNQRKSYRLGYLKEYQIEKLSEIGITVDWLVPPTPFEKGYAYAKDYYEKNGHLNVPSNFQHESGFWLGFWIGKTRQKQNELTAEQIQKLDEIGFVWDLSDNFDERFVIAERYYIEHGFLPLEPKQCQTPDELHICQWLRRQLLKRNAGKLEQKNIDRLTAIGMDWQNSRERAWNRGYTKAKEYHAINGNLNVVVSYVCEDGFPLGEWLHSQRTHRKRLPEDRLKMLLNLGMVGIS